MSDKYYLKADHQTEWDEVSREQFVAAEQAAGFRSKFGPSHPATSGFSGGGMRGKVLTVIEQATKEQPMSDTLLEPEDQAGEHQVTKSGTCVIPGCPCRGWSAQETVGVKEVAEYHPPTLIDAAKGIEQWWLEQGMHAFNGAPAAMFDLRAAIADHDQRQPAARGGGDAAGLVPATVLALAKKNQEIYDTDLSDALVKAVEVAHAEHQSLVAERERLSRTLRQVRNAALVWADSQYLETAQIGLRQIASDIDKVLTTDEQRSTSE